MSPVLHDATSDAYDAMLDTMPDDAMLDTMPDDAMLDTSLPLGALDAHIARIAAGSDDTSETVDTIEVEPATMPVMPDTRYVMEGEIAEDFLACKDSYDVEKLLHVQPSNEKDVEIEPTVDLDNPQPKKRRYDKNDFAARKHDMLKMSLYAKYMKDIVTNKRRIPDLEISAMLANYTFKGGILKKQYRVHCINAIEKTSSILTGSFECPIPRVKMKYDLLVGEIHIPIEVT
ncbi:hypothetical protein ZWY2020_055779 [Hordeum vulgare]|nr:hypothetical protein ZWY2020_055779 [Hordeum vulgare]